MQYFRYVNVRYHDEAVEIRAFEVVEETEKTVVLNDPYYLRGPRPGFRRVLKGPGHRYAHPTRREALEDFIARKARQAVILRSQAARVAAAREIGDAMRKLEILPDRMEGIAPAADTFDFVPGPTSLGIRFSEA